MRALVNRVSQVLALAFVCVPGAFAATAADPTLGAWGDYALRSMTPDFTWSDRASAAQVTPTVFDAADRARDVALPHFNFFPLDDRGALSLAVSRSFAGDLPMSGQFAPSAAQAIGAGVGIERTLIAPSLSRAVGDATVTGSVVLAEQQFASWGMGAGTAVSTDDDQLASPFAERSYGSAVRLAYQQPLSERLSVTAAYQSRLDMDAFQSYRGVFSDPGDFDLPSVASAGLGFRTGERSSLGMTVSRVGYSEINAFTSSALPTRLLALLGDGSSPVFAWRDLTMYSLDWRWQFAPRDTFTFRYTTQQQPEPTSRLLYSALEDTFTDDNFAMEWTHRFTRYGSLRLAASYAPVQYFLGNMSYASRDEQGDQLEVQAAWSIAF